ncbi:MAG: hypothetical protein IJI77_06275, partial [Erysipelotrichaceae bacterium]|nr:hypothetical protein [Erysipelotrichaceae bacterium]
LNDIQKDKHPFVFAESDRTFLYQKKEILLNNTNEFLFDEYFSFIGSQKPPYRYHFDDSQIIISFDEHTFTFPFHIKESEKEIIETVIIKEVYKEKPTGNSSDSVLNESRQKHFDIVKDYFSFSEGTDLSVIISQISNAVDTNERIVIDYSMLNPNEKGTYHVFLSSDEHSAMITVDIL